MFKRVPIHLKRHRLKYIAFAAVLITTIITKVVLVDVVYIGKHMRKIGLLRPGEKK